MSSFDSDPNVERSLAGRGEAMSPMVGHLVRLKPITPRDYESLYQVELGAEAGRHWRLKGATPSFEAWREGLWHTVLAQFLIVEVASSSPIGMVTAYNANFRDRWAYVAFIGFRSDDGARLVLHGVALFLAYVFETWDFRKLYAEVAGYNLGTFRSAVGKIAAEEGLLLEHEFAAGQWWSKHVLAIYRDTWEGWKPVVMPEVVFGRKHRQSISSPADVRPTREWNL